MGKSLGLLCCKLLFRLRRSQWSCSGQQLPWTALQWLPCCLVPLTKTGQRSAVRLEHRLDVLKSPMVTFLSSTANCNEWSCYPHQKSTLLSHFCWTLYRTEFWTRLKSHSRRFRDGWIHHELLSYKPLYSAWLFKDLSLSASLERLLVWRVVTVRSECSSAVWGSLGT